MKRIWLAVPLVLMLVATAWVVIVMAVLSMGCIRASVKKC